MNFTLLKSGTFFILVLIMVSVSSCVNTRKAVMFPGISEGVITASTPVPENIIRKNDILSITISALDPKGTEIFNAPNTTSGTLPGGNNLSGYLVSADGTIYFPLLGHITAHGLTKDQLKESITKKLVDRKLLVDPIVSIRFLNFRVTVLGEVGNPSVLNVQNEKISLLEAIGLAGDITIYGKRDNVLVIREEENQKTIKRLNLNSNELLSSPYYYLKSGDVVYVEPNKVRIATAGRGSQWVPIVFSALSFAAILVDRVSNK